MRKTILRGLAMTALLAVTVPAAAGEKDRAREAIAAARAKVEASAQVAGGDAPRLQAEARASLRTAEEAFANSREKDAIAAANHAQTLAETAIGVGERNKQETQAAVAAGAAADVAAAQNTAADAQASAAAADQRADAAERAAAAASADAAAARAAQTTAATTTTVQTETTAPRATTVAKKSTVTKKVTRKPTARIATTTTRPAAVKTTTTVTTTPQ